MSAATAILSWGPPRMGTTWLFNVLKELTSASGLPTAVIADGVEPPPPDWPGSVIIKSHRADPVALVAPYGAQVPLAACVMVRDALATFRSLVRTQKAGRSEVIGWLENDMASYEAVLPSMSHVAVIREEWVDDQAVKILHALAAFLELSVSDTDCQAIADSLSRAAVRQVVAQLDEGAAWSGDFRNYDTQSQWHAGHIAPENQPDIVITHEEQERLSLLQDRMDALAARFPLWQAKGIASSTSSGARPIDYAMARQALLFPPPTFWAKVRHGLGFGSQ